MKRLQITNYHGWTLETVVKYERSEKNASMRHRIAAIRLIMQGYMGKEVAEVLNLHRQSVSTYVKNFNEGGMEKLLEREYPPGKKPYLTNEEENELKRMIVESTPAEEGFDIASSWDTRVIQYVLEEKFSVTMNRASIAVMLHRMGLRYTRPTYTLAKANTKKQQEFTDQLNLIKKTFPMTWC